MPVIDLYKKGDIAVGDKRWMVTCPTHKTIHYTRTRRIARFFNAHKQFFCVDCKHERNQDYVRKEGHL